MTGFTTVTSKYQLTLPVQIARYAGLTPGVRVFIGLKDTGEVLLEKAGGVEELAGMFADLPRAKKYTVRQALRIAKKREAARIANEA